LKNKIDLLQEKRNEAIELANKYESEINILKIDEGKVLTREDRLKDNLRALSRNVQLAANYRPLVEPGTYGPDQNMREGTRLHRYFINFAFNEGGIGDYINYSVALIWLKKNVPWIDAQILVSRNFIPLFRHIFDQNGVDWPIIAGETANQAIEGTPVIGPELRVDGRNMNPQLINPIGAHLIDLGFAYYANKLPAPAGAMLPRISFDRSKIPHKVRHLRGKYVVFPMGTLTPSRFVSGEHIMPIVIFVKDAGFTPIFIGKKNPVNNLSTVFADDMDFTQGIDLREQTDLLTAGAIMHHSAAVVGMDSGMMHLASCTDAPVLFGYSIAGPDQRAPRRNWSKTYNMFVTKEELSCAQCQSNWKVMLGHTFHRCLYRDNKCIDMLFIDKFNMWKNALTECFVMYGDKNELRSEDFSSSNNVQESGQAQDLS
jgi:Glycosyltransferase family 9 (heptosyltransferase)